VAEVKVVSLAKTSSRQQACVGRLQPGRGSNLDRS
jgi:hypothetical protein